MYADQHIARPSVVGDQRYTGQSQADRQLDKLLEAGLITPQSLTGNNRARKKVASKTSTKEPGTTSQTRGSILHWLVAGCNTAG